MARITLPAGTDLSHLYTIDCLAYDLLAEYGLHDWSVRWIKAHRTAGECDQRNSEIRLSAPLMALWTVDQARTIILHEIAHALTPGHGHDAVWQAMCLKVGIKPERCWGRGNEPHVPDRWKGVCPSGHISYRRLKPTKDFSCAVCSRSWNRRYIIIWTDTREV